MIQPNELRIRNLVLDSLTGEECTVDAIDLYGHVYTEDKNYDDFKRTIQPEGIELSEDWLKRIHGLEPAGERGYHYVKHQYAQYYLKFNSISKKLSIGIVTFNDDGQRNGYVNFVWDIEYVHTLQNAWHSLTGEELTLSE